MQEKGMSLAKIEGIRFKTFVSTLLGLKKSGIFALLFQAKHLTTILS